MSLYFRLKFFTFVLANVSGIAGLVMLAQAGSNQRCWWPTANPGAFARALEISRDYASGADADAPSPSSSPSLSAHPGQGSMP